MNFLAHLALSGRNEDRMMGNYVGDFIKGRLIAPRTDGWSDEFVRGVVLHRFIDSYTDTHPDLVGCRRKIAERHPKVSNVALDLYFDYFLAHHFDSFHGVSLSEFTGTTYRIIRSNTDLVPPRMRPMSEALVNFDWLTGYGTVEGLRRAFDGLARRFPFMRTILGAETELLANRTYYEQAFLLFYPQLKQTSQTFLASASAQPGS